MGRGYMAILEEIIQVHLPYELTMLCETFERIGLASDPIDTNSFIESFCLHARNLIDFFENDQGAHAQDFLIVGEHDLFSDSGKVAKPLKKKLNTQIAHLTMERTADAAKKVNDADRRELLATIAAALSRF